MVISPAPIEDGKERASEEAEAPRLEPSERKGKAPLEEEILELERKIEQKKHELEKVKRIEGAVEKISEKTPAVTAPAISAVTAPAISREEELTEEEKKSIQEIKNLPRQKQLETLINIALWRGLSQSIKIARSLNNAYILDEFHDTLIDKLYKELLSRGQLKEE